MADAQPAQDGDNVQVHYTGTLDNGEVFDSSRPRGEALNFTVGAGQVISGFDDAVRGLNIGESRTVRIEPAQAYGERDEELVVSVPADQAPDGLTVGDSVRLGERPAVVTDVSEQAVTVDANHPLAGQALTFEIELVGKA